tara:strand:+ start:17696 stop:18301 length:606 start_codon:yes stop_codon:yes gene_type:complete
MTYSPQSLREISPPARVIFAGFESTTLKLQMEGWQLSMEQVMDHHTYGYLLRLAMKHDEAKLYALTDTVSLPMRDMMSALRALEGRECPVTFRVQMVSSSIHFRVTQMGPTHFMPIDAIPELQEVKSYSFEDLVPFKKIGGKEIWLDPANKDELMDHLLKIQSKEQDEIRERTKAREKREWLNNKLRPASETIGQILVGVA